MAEVEQQLPRLVHRRGGWFVADEVKGWSGPWLTAAIAELARRGDFADAHAAEIDARTKPGELYT